LFKWSKNVTPKCTAEKNSHYPLGDAGCWADCVRTRKPVIHNDYASMTKREGKRGMPEGHIPVKRHMSVPILDNNHVVAVAGVGNKKNPYESSDVKQLSLFMNTMWDILKRKKISAALQESERKFEMLFDISPDPIAVVDLSNSKFVNVNEKFANFLGLSKKEIVGKDSIELGVWQHHFDRNKFYEELDNEGKVQNMVVKFRIKEGDIKTGLLSATKIKMEGKDHLLVVVKDITGIFKNENTNS
jgi:PAS domain S-box-containing protein